MSDKQPLGKLVKIDLREYWEKEDKEFTPWLAESDNLQYLSETVGMDLEMEDTEARVGPYRADILCRIKDTDTYVLVENQLEQTDHLHLGQLMTYAAGLDTAKIIWIAKRFNEEHRAALDWLNNITDENFHFFGIEVELWKIGDSVPAPKFNIIAKPNEWSKSIKTKKQANWAERALLYRELWSELLDYLNADHPKVDTPNTTGMHWIRFPLTDSKGVLSYATKQKKLSLYLLFRGDNSENWFQFIKADDKSFKKEIGHSFEWKSSSDDPPGHGLITFNFDHLNLKEKTATFKMIGELLERLTEALLKRHERFLKKL